MPQTHHATEEAAARESDRVIAENQWNKQRNFIGVTNVRAPSIGKSGYFMVVVIGSRKFRRYRAKIKFDDRPNELASFADKHEAATHVDDCLYEHDLLRYLKYANFKESERYTAALARYKKAPSVAAAPTGRAAVPAKKAAEPPKKAAATLDRPRARSS